MNYFAQQSLHPQRVTEEEGRQYETPGRQANQNNPETFRLPHHLPNPDSEYWDMMILDNDQFFGIRLYDFHINYLYNVTNGFSNPHSEDIIRNILMVGPNTTMGDGTSIRDLLESLYNHIHDYTTVPRSWRHRANSNQDPERTGPLRSTLFPGGKRRRKTKRKRKKSRKHR